MNKSTLKPTWSRRRKLLHIRTGGGTGDNLNQLAGNGGLALTVVQDLELVDHLTSVLGGVLHGVATSGDLTGVTLSHGPEEVVGKSVLAEAGQNLIVNLVRGDVGGLGDSLLGVGLNGDRLVALSVDERVVDDANAGVILGQESDLVGNGLGIGEGGDVLADVGEAQNDVLGVGTGERSLGLLTENSNVGVGVRGQNTAGGLAQTGVDTTAKTLVGAGNNQKNLLVLQRLGLGLLENGVGGLTIDAGFVHGLLSTGKTSGGNNLHGVGDLLNVLDGLETTLNLTQSREGGGIGGGRASDGGTTSPQGRADGTGEHYGRDLKKKLNEQMVII